MHSYTYISIMHIWDTVLLYQHATYILLTWSAGVWFMNAFSNGSSIWFAYGQYFRNRVSVQLRLPLSENEIVVLSLPLAITTIGYSKCCFILRSGQHRWFKSNLRLSTNPFTCRYNGGIRFFSVVPGPNMQWSLGYYPTLPREFQGFRVWGKFVFRTLEHTDTPTNLANQVKVGHTLDQSRSVQSRGPERAHQNNKPSWRSSKTDRRLSRQFWDD